MSLVFFLLTPELVSGVEVAPRITDREIVERLTQPEEDQKQILSEINRQFEMAGTNSHPWIIKQEQADKQFQKKIKIAIGIMVVFAAIIGTVIGFAIWDRRTALRPFLEKAESFRAKQEKLEQAVREFAKVEPKMAEVLRSISLLSLLERR